MLIDRYIDREYEARMIVSSLLLLSNSIWQENKGIVSWWGSLDGLWFCVILWFFFLLLGFDELEPTVFFERPLYLPEGSGKVCVHSTLQGPHFVGFHWVCCCCCFWYIIIWTDIFGLKFGGSKFYFTKILLWRVAFNWDLQFCN